MQLGNLLLESTPRLCAEIAQLTDSVNKIALTSYNTTSWKDGTIGQIEEMTQRMQLRNDLAELRNYISTALSKVDKPLRQLLTQVYIIRRKPKAIASKYHVTPANVYNKLSAGKKIFCANLKSAGCTLSWIKETFSDVAWLCKLVDKCDENTETPKSCKLCNPVQVGVANNAQSASSVVA